MIPSLLTDVAANTAGFTTEFNGVTKIVVQITKSVGYLCRNKDVKYMTLVGTQQIIFDVVIKANCIIIDFLSFLHLILPSFESVLNSGLKTNVRL